MNVERQLKDLLNVVIDELRQNSVFAERLAKVLGDGATARSVDKHQVPSRRHTSVPNAAGTMRRGNRRAGALVHPLTEIAQGEGHLRSQLDTLDLEQLRDVVAEYGMDPNRLVMKWKDRDRVVDHIVATAANRARKGDAFRA